MAGHKHAALMAEYAKDAAETETPWDRWECLGALARWERMFHSPGWHTNEQYRRKPPTLTIAGREIAAPLRSAMEGQTVYATDSTGGVAPFRFSEEHINGIKDALVKGRLFATPQAAKAAYDAITELFTGETK